MAPDAPSLGLEPPAFSLLARMLVRVAAASGAGPAEAADVGREQGRVAAGAYRGARCLDALVDELARLGFDPAVAADGDGTTVAFAHCPFADLAAAHPELVCHLHRGMVEGLLDELAGPAVEHFGTLLDREPCQVALAAR